MRKLKPFKTGSILLALFLSVAPELALAKPPVESVQMVNNPFSPPHEFTPEEKLAQSLAAAVRTMDPEVVDSFLKNHPEANLNQENPIMNDGSTLMDEVLRNYEMTLGWAEKAKTSGQEVYPYQQDALKNQEQIMNILTKKGGDIRGAWERTRQKSAEMHEIGASKWTEEVKQNSGFYLFEQLQSKIEETVLTVGQTSPAKSLSQRPSARMIPQTTAAPVAENTCSTHLFQTALQDLWDKVKRMYHEDPKTGELHHHLIDDLGDGCSLSLSFNTRNTPAEIQVFDAKIANQAEKALNEEIIQIMTSSPASVPRSQRGSD